MFVRIARQDGRFEQELCQSPTEGFCSDPSSFISGFAIMDICKDLSSRHCIESVAVFEDGGSEVPATLVKQLPGFLTQGQPSLGIPAGSTPSLWSVVDAAGNPHTFAVIAGAQWSKQSNSASVNTFSVQIAKVVERPRPGYRINEPTACIGPVGSSHEGIKGSCATHNPGKEGCFYSLDGACGQEQRISPTTRIKIAVRLSNEVGGWFQGRLKDPVIEVSPLDSKTNNVSISALPVTVPKLHTRWDNNVYPGVMTGVGSGMWGEGNFLVGSRNPQALELVSRIRAASSDRAVGQQSLWAVESTGTGSHPCMSSRSRLLGVVTTNAMAFEGNAPRFVNSRLEYRVAGMHYLEDGATLALGTYDLVMRADVARCLYRFSRAPIGASISISGEGDKTIATTVVGERNGWLKLAAYGFTFSNKTIQVRLTQKRVTISCISTTQPTKTRKVTGVSPKCPSGFRKR